MFWQMTLAKKEYDATRGPRILCSWGRRYRAVYMEEMLLTCCLSRISSSYFPHLLTKPQLLGEQDQSFQSEGGGKSSLSLQHLIFQWIRLHVVWVDWGDNFHSSVSVTNYSSFSANMTLAISSLHTFLIRRWHPEGRTWQILQSGCQHRSGTHGQPHWIFRCFISFTSFSIEWKYCLADKTVTFYGEINQCI